ncbi:pseudouridylate synthase 7 homolog isoform X1 [Daphnia magna]|uniref:pseudouridylate synthase 7 homolog isoform X1 n=2 Tax=Daphnia magna TaxID=35525 RepID=UPI0006DF7F92|nr:pseudouridylate synthase 7 homolog isoform X1 [Daphnia magna]XP_032794686.2 pseudouridylate synthase 7 homolog isoform X1 [Daphnia magna]XP_032794687.2 pseudouridylate synthase 7 homolog isoform X1 [Daphnia magna]XP_032794688.2 pseudouridylate synthase 7 homolog isoform X1 [Daphnia magna]
MNAQEVGIIQYVSNGKGFSAVWKSSDFQVNEISLDGKEIHLTDRTLPDIMVFPKKNIKEFPSPYEQNQLLTADQWNEIDGMIKNELPLTIKIDVCGKRKDERQSLARVLSVKYEGLSFKTVCNVLQISKRENVRPRIREPPPSTLYTQFVLYKENLSTATALAKLYRSRKPSLRPKFWTAGDLPKRANTSQLVTAFDWSPLHVASGLRSNVIIGNYKFTDKPLVPGHRIGSHYTIALRQVMGDASVIKANLESLKINGFINYYDVECFGRSREAPLHLIGKCLLKKNWQEVINLMLEPSAIDPGDVTGEEYAALVKYKVSRNAWLALENVPSGESTSIECKLLYDMKNRRKNVNRLIRSIPRSKLRIYVRAYLRFLWNMIASERIAKFGLEPIIGDLVYAYHPENGSTEKSQRKIILLDEGNIRNYTISDVMLPLPGIDGTYPLNEVANYNTNFLLKDGLLESDLKRAVKDYSVDVEYRPVVAKPFDIVWYFIRYSNPSETLVWSDMDRMRKKEKPNLIENGAFLGLVIEFDLLSSVYATMALREITKMDTIFDFVTPNVPGNETLKADLISRDRKSSAEPKAKRIKLMDTVEKSIPGV